MLTGIGRIETQVDVADANGRRFRIRSLVSAAQESRLQPKDLLVELNGRNHWSGSFDSIRNAVVLVRYDAVNGCPEGKVYIEALIADGWHVNCIASLGESARDWICHSGIRHIEVADSACMASNQVAGILRHAFTWQ